MPDQVASRDEPLGDPSLAVTEDGGSDSVPQFPLPVRILAVAYVLSWALQPLGFFLLTGIGSFLWIRRRELDAWVLGFWLGGIGCLVLGIAFRWWFRRWGRLRWPNG
jgi:hypothetical protein